jgi:hypothetical protein
MTDALQMGAYSPRPSLERTTRENGGIGIYATNAEPMLSELSNSLTSPADLG